MGEFNEKKDDDGKTTRAMRRLGIIHVLQGKVTTELLEFHKEVTAAFVALGEAGQNSCWKGRQSWQTSTRRQGGHVAAAAAAD